MIETVTRDELQLKMKGGSDFVLLEALPPFMFHAGHLPGATNLPPDTVVQSAPTLLPDNCAEIVVYCQGTNSDSCGMAARMLLALGYTNVRVYREGKDEWVATGLPIQNCVSFL